MFHSIEMTLAAECRNAKRIAASFAGTPNVAVPSDASSFSRLMTGPALALFT